MQSSKRGRGSARPGRGKEATEDMKARVKAGWTVMQLWERYHSAHDFEYDAVEKERDNNGQG